MLIKALASSIILLSSTTTYSNYALLLQQREKSLPADLQIVHRLGIAVYYWKAEKTMVLPKFHDFISSMR